MGAADSRTGILTLLLNTCQVRGALLVDGALRLALHIGVAYVVSYTSTRGGSTVFGTLGVDAARRRIARTNDLYGSLGG